jgi:asparagine N-glycosylation enzyme membrane subunit Stt3
MIKTSKWNANATIILIFIVVISFLYHCSLYFLLDTSRYNFYDTDTWYSVHEIERLTNGENIDFDPLMNYPEGRVIDWGMFVPSFYSLFASSQDTLLDIFNKLGFIPPILSALFLITVFILVSILFSQRAGLISLILLSVVTGGYFLNSLFGIIDHHLIECILTTVGILCILIAFKKSKMSWLLPLLPFTIILFFTSTIYTIYLGLWALCILTIIKYTLWNKNKTLVKVIIISSVILGAVVISQIADVQYLVYLWFNYLDPISEIAPLDIMTFFIRYNILIPILIFGISAFSAYKHESTTIALVLIVLCLLLGTSRFSRIDYILAPLFIILSAYYIDKFGSTKSIKFAVCIFCIISVIMGIFFIYEITQSVQENSDWNKALEFLESQNPGLVLSWWDYGHWIIAVSKNPPYTDPFQDRIKEASRIFTSNTTPNLDGISYIVVTENDHKFYDAMVWYSKSNVSYDNSYLHRLIIKEGVIPVFEYGSIKIYD